MTLLHYSQHTFLENKHTVVWHDTLTLRMGGSLRTIDLETLGNAGWTENEVVER